MTRDDQLTGTVASMATLESITSNAAMIGPFPTPTIRARDATTTITFVYDSEAMRGSTTSLGPMPTVTDPHSPFYTLHTPPISPVVCWGLVVLFVIIYITVVRWVSIGDIPDAYKAESIVVTRDWWKKTGPRASDAVRAEQALERAKAAAAASASTTTLVEKGEWAKDDPSIATPKSAHTSETDTAAPIQTRTFVARYPNRRTKVIIEDLPLPRIW
ncbi:hypothetical protein B0H10DRAFT_2208729 [Mycena sp. CBHHK59/15]|nr:hypothetical protein B0H10DRAFT_2208729 [Mycena sp. CBHHK59/15]